MANNRNEFLLKYGIPSLVVMVVGIQLFMVHTQNLSAWKGGGYGMYTNIHYYYNQIYIDGVPVDSLTKHDRHMKRTLGYLMLIPNQNHLKNAGHHVLKTLKRDSLHIQIWKPAIDPKSGRYSKVLVDELYLKNTDL